MDEQNPHAKAYALKQVLIRNELINRNSVTSDMTEDEINVLVEKLAKAKDEQNWKKHLHGQRLYIEGLVAFCSLEAQQRWDLEYKKCFSEFASEEEGLEAIKASMAT